MIEKNKTLELGISLINNLYPHVLEFGVWKGTTLKQLREQLPTGYKIFGFDSFLGLPEDWTYTNLEINHKGVFTLNGIIPDDILNLPDTQIISGWFKDSIPKYLEVADDIALIHIDSDLYSSCIDILYSGIKNHIKNGTILVFDEWYYNQLDIEPNRQHEQKAFYEWVNDFNIEYELIPPIENERQIIIIKNISDGNN